VLEFGPAWAQQHCSLNRVFQTNYTGNALKHDQMNFIICQKKGKKKVAETAFNRMHKMQGHANNTTSAWHLAAKLHVHPPFARHDQSSKAFFSCAASRWQRSTLCFPWGRASSTCPQASILPGTPRLGSPGRTAAPETF
jgi:hypothetical protein